MKILLAADGSEYTQRMIDYVTRQHQLFDPAHDYTVLTVQMALPNHAASVVGTQATQEYYEEESNKVLQPAVAQLAKGGLRVNGVWKVGHLGETIAQFAEQNGYDLVIMGSHGHNALGRLVMGSVASRVLANCKVPVLLVR